MSVDKIKHKRGPARLFRSLVVLCLSECASNDSDVAEPREQTNCTMPLQAIIEH